MIATDQHTFGHTVALQPAFSTCWLAIGEQMGTLMDGTGCLFFASLQLQARFFENLLARFRSSVVVRLAKVHFAILTVSGYIRVS